MSTVALAGGATSKSAPSMVLVSRPATPAWLAALATSTRGWGSSVADVVDDELDDVVDSSAGSSVVGGAVVIDVFTGPSEASARECGGSVALRRTIPRST